MSQITLGLRRFGGAAASLDRAAAAVLLVVFGLALVDVGQLWASLAFTATALANVAPWIAISVTVAAYAAASGADHLIARAFQGRLVVMVVLAAIVGAFSPFCSCGVIPLIAALLAMGVPLAPVMAFWLASPLMDPAMFAMTTGALGLEFALAKTASAIGIGLLGGFVTAAIARTGALDGALREEVGNGGCGGARVRNPKPPVWAFWREDARREKFGREWVKTALFLGKWLTLAFVLESLMVAYLPAGTVASVVGGEGLAPIVVATLVGVPAYLNGYAALPLVSGLMEQGMTPGAGLAFLVAGGVSSIPAAIAVFALVKKPVFALYLAFAFVGSVGAGLIFQAVAA